jgi:hypothetical protein
MENSLDKLLKDRMIAVEEAIASEKHEKLLERTNREERIIDAFGKEYPQLCELSEFSWKRGIKFIDGYGNISEGLAFLLGDQLFAAQEKVAGACVVCPHCGIYQCRNWLRDEEILDYLIDNPNGNKKMEKECHICEQEHRKASIQIPEYPKTAEEKVFMCLQEIVDLLGLQRPNE